MCLLASLRVLIPVLIFTSSPSVVHSGTDIEGDDESLVSGMDDDHGSWRRIVNTCHVWDADGPAVAAVAAILPVGRPGCVG